jgi:hypothetical protein
MKTHPVQNETDMQRYNWLTISTRWQIKVNVKIKCTAYLEQATEAQRTSTDTALLFHQPRG